MKKDKLKIIYQDKNIIVIDKEPNLFTIATEREKENTLYHKVLVYEKQKHKANKIFIVHRLDKETSGIIVFAKNEKVKNILQDNWDKYAIKRNYVAVVEGKVNKKEDEIRSYLKETETHKVYSSKDGKLAITKYKLLNTSKSFSLLEIEILTGRKNQIRVHMSDINHPIIGDKKYNSKTNPIKRLGLHANKLVLKHPITNEIMTFETEIPKEFIKMFPKNS